MNKFNYLKMKEAREDLKTAEDAIMAVAEKDDANHTLMFAAMNVKAAVKERDRSLFSTRIELSDSDILADQLEKTKNILGL